MRQSRRVNFPHSVFARVTKELDKRGTQPKVEGSGAPASSNNKGEGAPAQEVPIPSLPPSPVDDKAGEVPTDKEKEGLLQKILPSLIVTGVLAASTTIMLAYVKSVETAAQNESKNIREYIKEKVESGDNRLLENVSQIKARLDDKDEQVRKKDVEHLKTRMQYLMGKVLTEVQREELCYQEKGQYLPTGYCVFPDGTDSFRVQQVHHSP